MEYRVLVGWPKPTPSTNPYQTKAATKTEDSLLNLSDGAAQIQSEQ